MASTKVRGIIIESKDYKDKDKLVTIYSLDCGKIHAVFRGVRGEKAKMKSARNVFTFGDFFIENTKGNNIVSQVDVIETFYDLSQNLDKYYEACSIIDIVKKLGNEQKDPVFFLEVIKALKSLCYDDVKKNYILNKFLLNVFAGAGYIIDVEKCSSCGAKITGKKFINYDIGEIVCSNCRTYTSEELSNTVASGIKIFENAAYDKLSTIKLTENTEKECLNILLKNFECRFGYKIFVVL